MTMKITRDVTMLGALMLGAVVACASPAAPSAATPEKRGAAPLIAPMHDNVPATFAGHPEGPTVWLCATQLRAYVDATGRTRWEEDHYLQYDPCPATPID